MATASTMATTLTTTATVKKPGPPVPPRPQHAAVAASLLKNQRESVNRAAANTQTSTSTSATATATAAGTSSANAKISAGFAASEQTHPVIQKKPILAPQPGAVGRTVIYKSPSMNLQKKQEEREKRYSGTDFSNSVTPSTTFATTSATIKNSTPPTGTATNIGPKPPLKLRKAPDVPSTKPRVISKAELNLSKDETSNSNGVIGHDGVGVEKSNSFMEKSLRQTNHNNIVIVQSSNGVNLNRHKSMSTPKPPISLKDTRLSLGRADFEQVGKIHIDQLQPGQPLPKPRKIVKMPVATLDVDVEEKTSTSSSLHSSGVSLFRRSKTTLDSLASRANVTTIATSTSTNGFLSGKTVEIKNNLKNAAERLFSEIIVNQHKQSVEPATIITKHERAVQHQALLEQELAQERQRRLQQSNTVTQAVTVVSTSTTPQPDNATSNCTRISIKPTVEVSSKMSPTKSAQMGNELNSTEKKTAFHEILISELAAMRAKSSSMENLHTEKISTGYIKSPTNSAIATTAATTFKTSTPVMRKRCNSLEDQDHDSEDVDADNVEDAIGDDEDSNKKHKVGASNSPRKRCPSGCSSDSSPYGTERSSRIRTSDWIEVGDNGKQVTLTSCHISLEDSGLEDEERIDEMSSSGVGDSWDSVKEAENEKRSRSVKRVMSITDLPPLPKSLSGITKMLGSDSGLISDTDASANATTINANKNDTLESEKENISNNVNNNNNNNNNFINNGNTINNNNGTCENESDKSKSTTESSTAGQNGNNGMEGEAPTTETTPATPTGSTLDTQLATLKKEMYGLRQLDLSLLSQLWALNDSIQEFRNMLQEQEQEMERESYSPTPSSYEDESGSSGAEAEGEQENGLLTNGKPNDGTTPNIITTQPKSTKSNPMNLSASPGQTNVGTETNLHSSQQQKKPHPQYPKQRPPLPKSLDGKLVPRMRSAPPPPPTNRKAAAPARPT